MMRGTQRCVHSTAPFPLRLTHRASNSTSLLVSSSSVKFYGFTNNTRNGLDVRCGIARWMLLRTLHSSGCFMAASTSAVPRRAFQHSSCFLCCTELRDFISPQNKEDAEIVGEASKVFTTDFKESATVEGWEENASITISQWNHLRDVAIEALTIDSQRSTDSSPLGGETKENENEEEKEKEKEESSVDFNRSALRQWLMLSCGTGWVNDHPGGKNLHVLTPEEVQLLVEHTDDSWWIGIAAQRIVHQFEGMALLSQSSRVFSHGTALLFTQTLCALMQSYSFHRVCLEDAHCDVSANRPPHIEGGLFADADLVVRIAELKKDAAVVSTDSTPPPGQVNPTSPSHMERLRRTLYRVAVPAMRESIFAITRHRLTFHILHSPTPVHIPLGTENQSEERLEGSSSNSSSSSSTSDGLTRTTETNVMLHDSPPLTGTERQHEKINYQLGTYQTAEEREHALLLLDTVDAILALAPPPSLHPILHSMSLPAVALCHEANVHTNPSSYNSEFHSLTHSALATLALALARCGQVGTNKSNREGQSQQEENAENLVSTVNSFTLMNELHLVADLTRSRMRHSLEVLKRNSTGEDVKGTRLQSTHKKPLRLHFSLKAKKEHDRLQSQSAPRGGDGVAVLNSETDTGERKTSDEGVLLMCDLAELCSALSSMHYHDTDNKRSASMQSESGAAPPGRDLFWGEVSNYFCAYVDCEMKRAVLENHDDSSHRRGSEAALDVSFSQADVRSVLFAIDYAGDSQREYDRMMDVLVKWGIVAEYIPPPSMRTQSMRRSTSPNKS